MPEGDEWSLDADEILDWSAAEQNCFCGEVGANVAGLKLHIVFS